MLPASPEISQEHKSLGWTIFIVFLSLLSIVAAIFLAFPALLPESVIRDDEQMDDVVKILRWADDTLCAIFFFDFAAKLAQGGWRYFYKKFGWLDLISSIPAFMVGWIAAASRCGHGAGHPAPPDRNGAGALRQIKKKKTGI